MKVNAEVKEGTSKSGNKYIYIEVKLSENYTKRIFLTTAEVEILKLTLNK